MSSEERRAPGTTRIPFESLVEVGGALGPSFEAQAVNVSVEGMLLRTAYLPEQGQPLTCRFDAAGGQSVLASGEVVWAHGAEKGGEFAIRFTEMDPESVDALKRVCGLSATGEATVPSAAAGPGTRVRLHIDGLASPMRAKIRDARESAITVGSDLGFLQVGKQLELEDAQSGAKRPARIHRVDVSVDPTSHVPSLVVTLRYDDVSESAASADHGEARSAAAGSASAEPVAARDDLTAVEDASMKMRGALARNAALIGPALERLGRRAKTTLALLAARRAARSADDAGAPRRTTSPPPGGALHASGKRVVRGEIDSPAEDGSMPRMKLGSTRGKAVVGGAVMLTAIVGAVALKKMHHEPAAQATLPEGADSALAAVTAAPTSAEPPAAAPQAALPSMPAETGAAYGAVTPPPMDPAAAGPDDDAVTTSKPEHRKHARVTPFGNGPVRHGNVLHLKMDGPIESIEGAQQPTGFVVKIPGRKAAEAAAPLAARDGRIAAIKVANESAGAELTLAFKDGVPNYQVSARGDTLIVALAPAGETEKVAKKDERGGKSSKHHKRELPR